MILDLFVTVIGAIALLLFGVGGAAVCVTAFFEAQDRWGR